MFQFCINGLRAGLRFVASVTRNGLQPLHGFGSSQYVAWLLVAANLTYYGKLRDCRNDDTELGNVFIKVKDEWEAARNYVRVKCHLKDAQKGYADMRGGWSRKCLGPSRKRFIDRGDSLDSVAVGKEFGMWVDALLAVAEDEYGLLSELSPLGSSSAFSNSHILFVNPLLVLFSTTTTFLVALIKHSLHRHTFLALSSYEALLASQPCFQKFFSCTDTNKCKESKELKEGLQSLRAVCLRSFPEFLADLKMASMSRTAEVAADVADFTISTVKYLERLPDVQGAMGAALLTLGDGNWNMGEGVQVTKGPKLGDGDEKVIVYYDVVSTLAGSLTAASKLKRPAFGAMYLLNNVAYVYNRVLENLQSSPVLGLL